MSSPASSPPAQTGVVQFLRSRLGTAITAVVIIAIVGVGVVVLTHHGSPSVTGGTGATVAYTELQAENAATNGTVIGPDYTFTHLASEASGRKAVTLTQGQYVEFTLPKAANSIDVRYSLPDSADGKGITAPLSIAINGAHNDSQTLMLTSKYSWLYGGYPFTNAPKDGTPHFFYNEAHLLLGEMPAGTKVRLQVDAADTAPSYTIDLADFEEVGPPLAAPDGAISITDPTYGADPTGAKDATKAIQQAIDAGSKGGQTVWIPTGTYQVNGHLTVDNVTLKGAGMWYATLTGDGVGIFGNAAPNPSKSVHLSDFAIVGNVNDRVDSAPLNGIGGAMGGGSTITNLWIEHEKVGMWFDGPFDGLTITGCRLRNLTADGLNFHDGISHAIVTQTQVRNTGDDGLAMWSDKDADNHNVFDSNTVQLPILANDIAIYGGADNRITNNVVEDSLTQGGGIHVGNRFQAVPLSGTTTISHNTLNRTGCLDPSWQYGVGALWFYALDSAMSGKIEVSQLKINDSPYEAIQFAGQADITNVTVSQVQIDKAGTFAVQVQSPGSATFNDVTATGLGAGGVYDCGAGLKITKGSGNTGWDATTCGFPS